MGVSKVSKLSELMRTHCPNGVEYKKLVECCSLAKGNTPIQKAIPGEFPLVVTTEERKSCNTYQFEKPTVCIPLVSSRGHGVASINQIYYQEGKFALGNILCGVTPLDENYLSAKFLCHYLNHKKDTILVPLMRGGANVSLTVDILKSVQIPIPAIEIQREIVRILDSFENLERALKQEFDIRKKQYALYISKCLESVANSNQMQFGDILSFQNGFAFKSSKFRENGCAILRITNIKDNRIDDSNLVYFDLDDYVEDLSSFVVEDDDLVIAMSGATTGKIGINRTGKNFYLNQRVGKLIPDKSLVSSKFLYYLLLSKSEEIYAISNGGAQPNLSSEKFKRIKVMIPSLDEQQRIVALLDNFDCLCNDDSSSIPAEIEARAKQYGYYRNRLLTFKELNVK